MGKFIISKKATGYHFNLLAANSQVVLSSQVYSSKESCLHGIDSVITNADKALVKDQTVNNYKEEKHPKFEVYKDAKGGFRFRLTASYGNNIGASEDYNSKEACLHGIESVRKNSKDSTTEEK